VSRLKKALLLGAFAALVLSTKACLEWLDGTNAGAAENDCCVNWTPCKDREPIRSGKRRLVWYCAPPSKDGKDGPIGFARETDLAVGERPAQGRTEKRTAGGRGCAPRGG